MNVLNSLNLAAKAPPGGRDAVSPPGGDRQDFAALMQDVPGAKDRPVVRDVDDRRSENTDGTTTDAPADAGPSQAPEQGEETPELATNKIDSQSQQPVARAPENDAPKVKPKLVSEEKVGESTVLNRKLIGREAKNEEKDDKSVKDAKSDKDAVKDGEAAKEAAHAEVAPESETALGSSPSVAVLVVSADSKATSVPDRTKGNDDVGEIGGDRKSSGRAARAPVTLDAKGAPVGKGADAVTPKQPDTASDPLKTVQETSTDSDAPGAVPTKPGEVTDLLDMLARTTKGTGIVPVAEDKAGTDAKPVSGRNAKLADVDPALPKAAPDAMPARGTISPNRAAGKDDVVRSPTNAAVFLPDASTSDGNARDNRDGRSASDRLSALIASSGLSGARGEGVVAGPFNLPDAVGTPITGPAGVGSNLSVALGQQVVDMGVTGQWLDRIAQQIAAVSNGEGRGSFNLNSETMGAMRVDLTPGASGINVRMSVESEAAATALTRDSGRLVQDAQLAAVRIAEVRVDRVAHVAEPARSETGNGQQQGQQQGQNPGSNGTLANMSQNNSQQRGAATMTGQDPGQGTGGNTKAQGRATVSGDRGQDDDGVATANMGARRARYA